MIDFLTDYEIKRELTEMLRDLDFFLQSIHVNYSIMYGTMLGAVRHKGFIPWDDDIDLGLLRDDYEKLIYCISDSTQHTLLDKKYGFEGVELGNGDKPFLKFFNKQILISSNDLSEKYLWIDLFPFDGVPSIGFKFYNLYFFKYLRVARNLKDPLYAKGMMTSKNSFGKNVYYKILDRIFENKNQKDLSGLIVKCAKRISIDKAKKVANVAWSSLNEPSFPKSLFESLTDYKFEDISVKGLEDYKLYLKSNYGDYMTLPPENLRQNHEIKAWGA